MRVWYLLYALSLKINNEQILSEKAMAGRRECCQIHGWDFSHIHGRYEEENDLPWNYGEVVKKHLKPEYRLLDLDTAAKNFYCHSIIRYPI